ncbi:tetratricopeptide repeat protein [Neisseria sp. CCUG12390]|uniref:O-linked N-acetylglucosamine transferase, SPINDLY family protein n=1 Tax=Neisseria sp. CCUG12390 TaxID=3392035 RepID=UPI003A0FF2C2
MKNQSIKQPAKPDLQAGFGEIMAAYRRQDFQTALSRAQELLAFYPQQEAVSNIAAVVLAQSGREEEAVAVWQNIPDTKKSHSVLNNLGNACRRLKKFDLAERYIRQSLKLKPDHAEAYWNLVLTLSEMQKNSDGLEAAKAFLALKPDDEGGLEYAAMFAFNAENFAEADEFQTALLNRQPERADIWLSNAWARRRLKRYPQAEASYRRALDLDDTNYEGWYGLAKTLHFQQKYEAACAALERALKLKPDSIEAQSDLVLNRLYVLEQAEQGAADSFRLGDLYAAQAENLRVRHAVPQPKARLHIGLVSSDLRHHPVGMFAQGLLCSDAAKQFDWTAYAHSDIFDGLSETIRPTFKAWHKIKDWPDGQVINQIVSDGIDILIDLNGHTAGHRMGVFAAQAAPVQAAWLGYFATTGLPTMQALIADGYCVPENEEKLYREKIYRLPHTRLNMRPPEMEIQVNALPAPANGYITFGCFQNLTKLNDHVLKTWAAMARKYPTAHWRFQTARLAGGGEQDAFKRKLLDLGFSDGVLHFHGASGYEDYFAAHHEVDMVLDTFPFPGGTTTADALWMGVPTLTLALEGMLSRQGQQLLSAAGLENWVCTRLDEYLAKTFYWADSAHWAELAALRQRLREQVLRSPLYDTENFARDWCETVKTIWQDACATP